VDLTPSCLASSSESCFTFNSAAMNFTVDSFELDASLEVYIGSELQSEATYKVLWIPVAPALDIPSLVDLGPAIGIEIGFELDIAANINFTFGAKGHIPKGAFASVSLVDGNGNWDPQTTATGWSGMSVDQIPFRVNDGVFNISTTVGFAPYAEIQFTILDIGASLRLVQSAPQASTNALLQTSVNRDCQSLGPNDFESFSSAFSVGAGLSLGLEAQLILEEGEFVGQSIPDNWNISLYNVDLAFAPALGLNNTACFVLSDDGGSSASLLKKRDGDIAARAQESVSGLPAATGTLLAASSAIPTWNMDGIQSYYSANGHLPTNVNYGQMVKATTVPDSIKSAVDSAASASGASGLMAKLTSLSQLFLLAAAIGGVLEAF